MKRVTRLSVAVALGAALVLAVTGLAVAGVGVRTPAVAFRLKAQLDVAQQVPQPAAPVSAAATGRFDGVLVRVRIRGGVSWTLVWRLAATGLSSRSTEAQIHLGAKGVAGPVLDTLCGPCTSPARGSAHVTPAQAAALLRGDAYVDVHTANNPNGEIRGQITRVRLAPRPSPPRSSLPSSAAPSRD